MKKVSVTDKYTYDGKEMTEREVEIRLVTQEEEKTSFMGMVGYSFAGWVFWYCFFETVKIICKFFNH